MIILDNFNCHKKMQKLERVCYLDLEEKRVMLTALMLACCSCRMFLLI